MSTLRQTQCLASSSSTCSTHWSNPRDSYDLITLNLKLNLINHNHKQASSQHWSVLIEIDRLVRWLLVQGGTLINPDLAAIKLYVLLQSVEDRSLVCQPALITPIRWLLKILRVPWRLILHLLRSWVILHIDLARYRLDWWLSLLLSYRNGCLLLSYRKRCLATSKLCLGDIQTQIRCIIRYFLQYVNFLSFNLCGQLHILSP